MLKLEIYDEPDEKKDKILRLRLISADGGKNIVLASVNAKGEWLNSLIVIYDNGDVYSAYGISEDIGLKLTNGRIVLK